VNPQDEESGIARIVQGNERDARELRANLAVFARRSNSPQITRMVSEVLAGRRNVREVFQTKEFNDALGANLDKIEEGISELTDEERAEVFDPDRPRTPQAKLDALRGDPGEIPAGTPDGDDEDGEPVLRIRSY
jgi:hypothetical protein